MAHTLPMYFPNIDQVESFDPSLLPVGVAELLALAGFTVEYEINHGGEETAMWVISSEKLKRGLGISAAAVKTYEQWQFALTLVLFNHEG